MERILQMSFSGEVKKELCEQISPARHCRLAEISAIIAFCGKIVVDKDQTHILKLQTESTILTKKIFLLLKQVFRVSAELTTRSISAKKNLYELVLTPEETTLVLAACKLTVAEEEKNGRPLVIEPAIVTKSCCRRNFIRGAFLAAGSVSNPNKAYHFEIVVHNKEMAEAVQQVANSFALDAKIVKRKKYYVVYLKEGAMIVDILNVMEAHISLMDMENVRILKDMRNDINRRVNCETANIKKTVNAARRQIEDIEYIEKTKGLKYLNDSLRVVAEIRLAEPDANLVELGEMLDPPVSKSGVNHRLRKISSIANTLREESIL